MTGGFIRNRLCGLVIPVVIVLMMLSGCGFFQQQTKSDPLPVVVQAPPPPPPPPPEIKEEPKKDVLVDLAEATICFTERCYPVLVGPGTPRGEFQLIHYTTRDPGYGGDILSFKETRDALYAIHRVINVRGQQRLTRLKSKNAKDRNRITGGCINVDPAVFNELIRCCSTSKLVIK